MGRIIQFSLNNKFAVLLLTVIVTIAGLYAGLNMKQETIPDIEVPILTVIAVYPGAASEEVAQKVTIPLEQRIKNLGGVDVVNSTSAENVSSIVVEYDYDKDMDQAENELQKAVSGFQRPQGVQDVRVSKINLNDFPVLSLSLSAGSGIAPAAEMTEWV